MFDNLKETFGVLKDKVSEHSPEILIATGIIGFVGAAVVACKGTTKVSEIFEEKNESLKNVEIAINNPECLPEGKEYTKEDAKNDKIIIYTRFIFNLVKIYGPSVLIMALSAGCIISSNGIMRKRNAAILAAYTSLDKAFKEYRKRVEEKYGKEAEEEIRYGIKDTGEKDKNGAPICESNYDGVLDYAFYFDKDSSELYDSNDNLNQSILRSTLHLVNDMLTQRKSLYGAGWVFEEEVRSALRMKRSKIKGQSKRSKIVGWTLLPNVDYFNDPSVRADGHISFGEIACGDGDCIFRKIVTPEHGEAYLIELNVDGPIIDIYDDIVSGKYMKYRDAD